MKVYISVDMEGASGITHVAQTSPAGKDYEMGKELLLGDVNAAIEGAFRGGATEVYINDAHHTMRNIDIRHIDSRGQLLSGKLTPLTMMEGLDSSFDTTFLVAYHSMVGSNTGVLNHTFFPGSVIQELKINGFRVGESAMNGFFSHNVGVPVTLVTGDSAAVHEAKEMLNPCQTVSVKEGVGKYGAWCKSPAKTSNHIRNAAEAAVHCVAGISCYPMLEAPYTWTVTFGSSTMADLATLVPQVTRISGRVVEFKDYAYNDCYRLFTAISMIGSLGVDHPE